ncbi:MAG TPA: DUF4390 domain-containing protein [Candidatus Polarisedimenticolia bacterium]|nr:DUF4390 domain-containing protein [Candidatus Polarisedimenticolia bacterium]
MKGQSLAVVGVCLVAGLSSARAADPALVDLSIARQGETYVASCRLTGWPTSEVREEIAAGLETSVGYRLLVYERRSGLPDLALARHRIRCTVRHDTLTRQYTLTRYLDDEPQETKVTTEAATMQEFMTALRGIPLLPVTDLAAGHEYYLKAKSDIRWVWRFFLIPWPLDTAWERVPIVIPEGKNAGTAP